jgi:anthranilate synthase component 1
MIAATLAPSNVASTHTLYPVVRELPADLETPVSAYLKLAGRSPSFLLESVTGGEQLARYSFIGVRPSRAFVLRAGSWEAHAPEGISALPGQGDAFAALGAAMRAYRMAPVAGLPRFTGGLVGYLGYDVAAQCEPAIPTARQVYGVQEDGLPEAIFLLADTVVAFDHAFGRILLIVNVPFSGDEAAARRLAGPRLDELQACLEGPLPGSGPVSAAHQELSFESSPREFQSNTSYAGFVQAVERAKEYIAAGDIFQVVLSQRFSRPTGAAPFRIYRALRRLNPSPYMFYFDFGGLAGRPLRLIGASPELHVRLENGLVTARPIAGTRPRGRSPERDAQLESELLADPKERAEHVMLVDLARNDLGRVCEYGSVRAQELLVVERYSHVMHIVSQIQGQLQAGQDGFDLMRATFPAGTVSGAPKIRAMQIIAELERHPRGPYAGAVGYFSFAGSLDTCITIRTLVMEGERVSIQAGAGIVADSDPDREYHETLNKARALAAAVEQAERER